MIIALRGRQGAGKSAAVSLLAELIRADGGVVIETSFAYPLKSFIQQIFGWQDEVINGPSAKRDEPIHFEQADAWLTYKKARHYLIPTFEKWSGQLGIDLTLKRLDGQPSQALAHFWRWHHEVTARALADGFVVPRAVLQTFGTEFARESIGPDLWARLALAKIEDFRRTRKFTHRLFGIHGLISDCRFDNEARAVHEAGGFVVEIVNTESAAPTSTHASEQPGNVPPDFVIRNTPSRGLEVLRVVLKAHLALMRLKG